MVSRLGIICNEGFLITGFVDSVRVMWFGHVSKMSAILTLFAKFRCYFASSKKSLVLIAITVNEEL